MKPLIVANWKMNPSNSKEAFDLASLVMQGLKDVEADVVLCPPFLYLSQLLASPNVFLGAQDCFWEQEGAFTGEISPQMLKNLGASYVILGHSERKKYVGETLPMVAKKVTAALQAFLIPVVCIGGEAEKELRAILKAVSKTDIPKIVFVYEPEWAISTTKGGKPESPEHAKAAMEKMKGMIGQNATILYGGSVNSKDVGAYLQAGAKGALVGAASLEGEEFVRLVKNAAGVYKG